MPTAGKSPASRRIPSTQIHGVSRAVAHAGGEVTLPVLVHGAMHGLTFSRALAQRAADYLSSVLKDPAQTGGCASAAAGRHNCPLLKPGGSIL
jgi:hypothetical protein